MSGEALNVVRRVYDALGRRDSAAVLALYHPEVEFDASGTAAGAMEGDGIYRGHTGLRRWARQWREVWDDYEETCEELIDAGDRVVAVVAGRGRGRVSGIDVAFPRAGVWTVRGGKVVRVEWYSTRAEALACAGVAVDRGTNVDLVRSIVAEWAAGDFDSSHWADPEIEFVIEGGPAPGRWRGRARIADGWRDFLGAWKEVREEPEQYIELDGERALVLTRLSGRGRSSGIELSSLGVRSAGMFHITGGKVTRLVFYFDAAQALADVGLAR